MEIYNDPKSTYFTMAIVLLPSILAVVTPVFPGSQSDLAVLINDTLVIVLITWIIKFTIAWPWNWLKQLNDTKETILKDIKSQNTESDPHAVSLLRRVHKYELVAIGTCIGGILVCSILMILTRNYIIVEESRKTIVFNDLNVGLFVAWGAFRVMLVVLNKVENQSLNHKEYEVIDSISNSSGQTYQSVHDKYKTDMETITKQVQALKEWINAKDKNDALSSKNNFIKPFPLNLNTPCFPKPPNSHSPITTSVSIPKSRPKPIASNSVQQPQNRKQLTQLQTKSPLVTDQSTAKYHSLKSSLETIFEEDNTTKYSLHGLPCSSQFKQLLTHKHYPTIEECKTKQQVETPVMHAQTETLRELIQLLLHEIHYIVANYSLKQLLSDPVLIKIILTQNFLPVIIKFDNSLLGIGSQLTMVKRLIWELSNKHVLGNVNAISTYIDSLYSLYAIKQCLKALLYITIKLPWNLAASITAIVFFIPRTVLQIFIVHPFLKRNNDNNLREFRLNRNNEFPTNFRNKKMVVSKLNDRINAHDLSQHLENQPISLYYESTSED